MPNDEDETSSEDTEIGSMKSDLTDWSEDPPHQLFDYRAVAGKEKKRRANGNKQQSKKKKESEAIQNIDPCPISGCSKRITVESCLRHFMHRHKKPVIELHENERAKLHIKLNKREFFKVRCLAIIAYKRARGEKLPAELGLCSANSKVEGQTLRNSLPVVLLGCWTNWGYGSKGVHADTGQMHRNILVVWAANVPSTRLLYYTLSACYTGSAAGSQMSQLHKMRRLMIDSQNGNEFIFENPDYVRLNYGLARTLSKNFSRPMVMDFMITEEPEMEIC